MMKRDSAGSLFGFMAEWLIFISKNKIQQLFQSSQELPLKSIPETRSFCFLIPRELGVDNSFIQRYLLTDFISMENKNR